MFREVLSASVTHHIRMCLSLHQLEVTESKTIFSLLQRDSNYVRVAESPIVPSASQEWTLMNHYRPAGAKGNVPFEPPDHGGWPYSTGSSAYGPAADPMSNTVSMDASRMTTDSRDEASASYSNASEVETEWVEQDEPGVYITIRQLVDGTRELRRVRFR